MATPEQLGQLKATLQVKFQAKIDQQIAAKAAQLAAEGDNIDAVNEKLDIMIHAMANFAMWQESKSDLSVQREIPKFHGNKDENGEKWLTIFEQLTERLG